MLDSRVYLYCKTVSNGGGVSTIKNIQIELGETFTDYEPYGKYKIPVTVSGNLLNVPQIFTWTGTKAININLPAGTYKLSWTEIVRGGKEPPALLFRNNNKKI